MDAIYLPVRPEGPKEGVLVAWGFTVEGERVLLDVALGQRERLEDWLDLGRGLTARGLRSPPARRGDRRPCAALAGRGALFSWAAAKNASQTTCSALFSCET